MTQQCLQWDKEAGSWSRAKAGEPSSCPCRLRTHLAHVAIAGRVLSVFVFDAQDGRAGRDWWHAAPALPTVLCLPVFSDAATLYVGVALEGVAPEAGAANAPALQFVDFGDDCGKESSEAPPVVPPLMHLSKPLWDSIAATIEALDAYTIVSKYCDQGFEHGLEELQEVRLGQEEDSADKRTAVMFEEIDVAVEEAVVKVAVPGAGVGGASSVGIRGGSGSASAGAGAGTGGVVDHVGSKSIVSNNTAPRQTRRAEVRSMVTGPIDDDEDAQTTFSALTASECKGRGRDKRRSRGARKGGGASMASLVGEEEDLDVESLALEDQSIRDGCVDDDDDHEDDEDDEDDDDEGSHDDDDDDDDDDDADDDADADADDDAGNLDEYEDDDHSVEDEDAEGGDEDLDVGDDDDGEDEDEDEDGSVGWVDGDM